MPQIIKLKRSATAGQVPTTAQLDLGEIAINTNDGKIFFKKDDGTESIVELQAAVEGEASKTSSSSTQPADPANGDLWFDTTNGKLKYYDGAAWQEVGSTLTSTSITGNSTLGDAADDALTVNATSTFASPATFNDAVSTTGSTTLGDAAGDTLTVNATSTYNAPVDMNSSLNVDGAFSTTGNTTLGDAAGDTLTVNATTTFVNAATFNGGVTVQAGDNFTFDSLAFNNAHKLTISNVSGTIVFGGWVLDTDTNTAN